MAKESGLGMTVAGDDVGGTVRTISNEITGLQWAMPSDTEDITGLDNSGMERLLLLADFTVALSGITNFSANLSHDVFKEVGVTSVTRTLTLTHSGQILETEDLFNEYVVTRPADGSRPWSAAGVLNETVVPAWTV